MSIKKILYKTLSKREQGKNAEKFAADYLSARGLLFIDQNYHTRFGEIDLIMKDKEILVFIEVRQRKLSSYGNAASSINREKQRKIRLTAQCYLHQYQMTHKVHSRFDVLAIDGNIPYPKAISWIKNAF